MSHPLLRYVIIPHPTQAAVLLLLTDQSTWTLPVVDLPGHFYTAAGTINQAIRAQLGIEITILQMIYRHEAPPRQPAPRVFTAENQSPGWSPPPGGCWITMEELATLALAVPEHRAVLTAWFADRASAAPPPGRVDWARPGWFREACTWIDQQVTQSGSRRTGPIEQLKVWSVSCLLTVPTTGGLLYFKASPPMLSAEMGVTLLISEEFPDQMPALVAVDLERRWMLTRAFTGPLLQEEPDLKRWEDGLRTYAQMQIAMSSRLGELLDAGCHDRTLPVIEAQLDDLLAETDLLQGEGRLTPEELAALRAMAPELRAQVRELERLGPPATLEHGDLHARNIALDGDRILVFDWSDGCVSHPFFGLVNFLGSLEGTALEPVEAVRQQLRVAYLEPWLALWPAERLETALKSAERIYELHLALFVRHCVLPGAENQAEWLWLPAAHLRRLLPA